MRILVFGASNSVMRFGWIGGLRASLPNAQIDVIACGSSVCFQFACYLDIDFSSYDVVFMDSGANDERFVAAGHDAEYLARIFYEICSTISSQTRLIVMGFTMEIYLNTPCEIHNRKKEISKSCGAQFIDVRSLVLNHGSSFLSNEELIYEDEFHPNRKISAVIGFSIGRHLECVLFNRFPSIPSTDYRTNFSHFDPSGAQLELEEITKSNAQFTKSFVIARLGDQIRLPKAGICLGFYVEKSDTKARMRAHAMSGAHRDIKLVYVQPPGSFSMAFQHFTKPMHIEKVEVISRHPNDKMPAGYSDLPEIALLSTFAFWKGSVDPIPSQTLAFDVELMHKELDEAMSREAYLWSEVIHLHRQGLAAMPVDETAASLSLSAGQAKIPAEEEVQSAMSSVLRSLKSVSKLAA